MNCPNCNCATKVSNSRQKGTRVRRRHKCPNNHRFTTWELTEMELSLLAPLSNADQELTELKMKLLEIIGRWS